MVEERLPKGDENPMKNYTLDILAELTQNGQRIDTNEIAHFVEQIKQANHIFLNGAGRSGIAIRAFANRLMHIGFSVSCWRDQFSSLQTRRFINYLFWIRRDW